jgi:hypothetical protein
MKTINLELTEESARAMLPILEQQHAEMQTKLNALLKQIVRIKEGLDTPSFSSLIGLSPQVIDRVEQILKTPHGRIKKGQSQKLIADFLKNRNGSGATIKEITAEAGTVYGTTRRVLKGFQDKHKATVKDGLWAWAA